jgi:hypothetical protein
MTWDIERTTLRILAAAFFVLALWEFSNFERLAAACQ